MHRHRTVTVALAAALSVLATAATEAPAQVLEDSATYIALLNAGQVVADPVPASNATGMAVLTYTASTGNLCFALTFSGLAGTQLAAPMGAHLHGPAGPGVANMVHVAELASGSPLNDCVTLTKEQAKALKAGDLYFQIHTDAYPTGEIRGQVLRTR